jgi:hypothetical protein
VLPANTIKGSLPRLPQSTVYVENSNNVSSLEDIMYVNDIEMGFQNPAFNGNSTIRFPRSYQFLGPTMVKFKVTYAGDGSTKALSNANNNDFVAYNLIRRLRWTVGGTEGLIIDGENLVDIVMQQCDTEMKKAKVLECAGVKVNIPASDAAPNSLAGPLTVEYIALIPTPWSSLATRKINSIKPLPLHMLSEPVELQIDIRRKDEVFTEGTAVGATVTLNDAKLTFSYGKLGNNEQLKKNLYPWPFTSIRCHKFEFKSAPTTSTNKIDLTGFIKGEVKQIVIHASTSGIYDGRKLKNIRLLFNGQEIWRGQGYDELWDLVYNHLPSTYGKRRIVSSVAPTNFIHTKNQAASTSTLGNNITNQAIAPAGINYYGYMGSSSGGFGEKFYYPICIGEILDRYQRQGHYLGAEFTKSSIQLEFDGLAADGTVYAAYYYHHMYQFDGEGALLVT